MDNGRGDGKKSTIDNKSSTEKKSSTGQKSQQQSLSQ